MKLAFDPAMYRDLSLKEIIDKTARLGYEYIELSPREDFVPFYKYPKVDNAMIQNIKRWCSDAGVKIANVLPVQYWAGPDEDLRQAAVRNWKRAIEITVDLGVDMMSTEFSGSKFQITESEGKFIQSMDELIPIWEREGLNVTMQAHPYDFIERNDDAMRMIRALNKSWINLAFSTAHAFYNDDGLGDIDTMFDDAGDKLRHVQISDTFNHKAADGLRYIVNPPGAEVTVHQHLNVGEGEVDFDTIFKRLKEMNFDGLVTNSVFAWVDKADESAIFMRGLLKEKLGI